MYILALNNTKVENNEAQSWLTTTLYFKAPILKKSHI